LKSKPEQGQVRPAAERVKKFAPNGMEEEGVVVLVKVTLIVAPGATTAEGLLPAPPITSQIRAPYPVLMSHIQALGTFSKAILLRGAKVPSGTRYCKLTRNSLIP
jgi:hypothetical protein